MNVRGLLLDLDGTLYTESGPIPGARETLTRLETAGIPYRYVTNTTRSPRREVVRRLRELNFPAREYLIFAPAAAANTLLQGRRVHALVAEPILEDLAGVILVDEAPEYVLVGDLGNGFDYARLNVSFRRLMDGADLVALQKNRFWQEADEPSLDAGPFVAALEYASGKAATAVVGKPEPAFFEAALWDLGLEAKDVAMVGDDPESDVAGAQAAGLVGIQVRTGKYRPGNGGEPDAEIESVARLPELLGL
ncbi:MAG: HAD-superfamily subfamily IIA hydrolase, hypothetical 2 [uncultured Rubrobacteraceae bacterium]|uniref:Haloacid dehalogenase-like hydrolase domain-containing protein 2 n=1 Tax=uncultured Rubrobacteraceae bacterium TaxID=349277 RepID=A0A6J4QDY1_9ACTN|nr:MAG: HAD-superfamily subfamily IIA hydrolase, hypothetical 2 [uncultured Rubrobacteraceae bacterium]